MDSNQTAKKIISQTSQGGGRAVRVIKTEEDFYPGVVS